jgi:hypothetical protein
MPRVLDALIKRGTPNRKAMRADAKKALKYA